MRITLLVVAMVTGAVNAASAQVAYPAPVPSTPAPAPAPTYPPPTPSTARPSFAPAHPNQPAAPNARQAPKAPNPQQQPAIQGPRKAPITFPSFLVSGAQCASFMGTQWACALMGYGCLMLPIPLTGPMAFLLGVIAVPGLAAANATVFGDYLSGQRHPLLIGSLVSYATIWVVGAIGMAIDAALVFGMYVVGKVLFDHIGGMVDRLYNKRIIPSDNELLKTRDLVDETGQTLLTLMGVAAVVSVVTVAALAVLPPLMTTLTLTFMRREPDEHSHLPRLVRREVEPEPLEDSGNGNTGVAVVNYRTR